MVRSKLYLSLFFIICTACTNNNQKTVIKGKGPENNFQDIKKEIKIRVTTSNRDSLMILKEELDSLIGLDRFANDGFFYYQRGECYARLEKFAESTIDFKNALKRGYEKESCLHLIHLNNELQKIKDRYK